MNKLLIVLTVAFALGFIPAASYAGWMVGQGEFSLLAGVNKAAKGGEISFENLGGTVIGAYIQNNRGEYLGQIRDLMIDPQDGGVAFAVLAHGGTMGIPMRYFAVPFSALTVSHKKNVYLLDISREKMNAAPSFARSQWPGRADREWEREVFRYYGETPHWGESYVPMAETWGEAYSFNQKIRGTFVKNQEGQDLGKILDIVIDSQGHVPFAVLSHGGFWGVGGKLVAVPFSVLSFDRMGKDLVLNSTKEKLDLAPAFKESDLTNRKWAEDVYRYFGQQPYWTEGGSEAMEKPMGGRTEKFEYDDYEP